MVYITGTPAPFHRSRFGRDQTSLIFLRPGHEGCHTSQHTLVLLSNTPSFSGTSLDGKASKCGGIIYEKQDARGLADFIGEC